MKKTLLVFLLSLGFSTLLSAQSTEKSLLTTEKFEISYSNVNCSVTPKLKPFEYGALKIVNKTDKILKLGFNLVTIFEEGCEGCNGSDESRFYIDLRPNETYQATCKTEDRSLFLIKNPNFSQGWNFKIAQIQNLDILP